MRFLKMLTLSIIAVTLTPLFALADAAAAPPSTGSPILTQLTDLLFSSGGIATIVTVLFSVVAMLVTSEVRRRQVALAVYHAFHIVEDIAAETPGTDALDKVAAGLKSADDYLKANGWRPLKDGEQAVAKLGFTSLNGASKLAEKVQTAALKAAVPVENPPTP